MQQPRGHADRDAVRPKILRVELFAESAALKQARHRRGNGHVLDRRQAQQHDRSIHARDLRGQSVKR